MLLVCKKIKDMIKKILPSFVYKALVTLKNSFFSFKHPLAEKKALKKKVLFYSSFIHTGSLVFDIGANMGNRIEAFLTITRDIVAAEPQPVCVTALKKKFGAAIKIEELGLAAAPGTMEMYIANESTVSTFSKEFIQILKNTRFKHNNWESTIQVPVSTLDLLIDKYGVPSFCKIDVEGFEYEVLSGLHKSLPVISFEYCVPEFTNKAIQCLDYLQSLDSTLLYNYSVEETMEWALPNWLSYNEFKVLVQTKSFEVTAFGDIYVKQPSIKIS
jgi:FkbM family methyltransferase